MGRSENAVKLQIITVMIYYVVLRLIRFTTQSLYTLREISIIIQAELNETISVIRPWPLRLLKQTGGEAYENLPDTSAPSRE